ncbi:peptidylprolyl isomerase [Stakelama tenebrarum]|uniref:Peptidylprolyl isomerase n=1 Tax=Stakelama tenebrarum TaxID=2711215 RepID=A0A6G6Y687_9SPHN|nr:peptidylprolyl isomerase [Sphingosinithalassobacter tenebrarum]QIG80419.1 peptidylprolyl isomerase [Sphingosinithalassobacter tenebrarum]
MLRVFRNITKSRIGLIVVFIVLGIIALAFAAADITGIGGIGRGSGAVVARVGDREITEKELKDRVQIAIDNLRRRGQTVTMEQFLAAGGLERALDQIISSAAAEQFARRHGIQVSRRLIDGVIASNTAFQGPDGKFDQQTYETLLARERISEADLRADLRAGAYTDWLIGPTSNAGQAPMALAAPYAALMTEERKGAIAFIPMLAMDPGEEPTDEQVAEFYEQNKQRYTIPERRVIRYAEVSPETLEDRTRATDEEIQQAYRAAGDRFAATEKRSVDQLIVGDQESAARIAEAVKGGQSIAAAARAEGLEPRSFDSVTREALAEETSDEVAQAVFAADANSAVGPIRSPLGWQVLRVSSVEQVAARSIADVRDTLAEEVRGKKLVQALVTMRDEIGDAIADGGTFQEVLGDTGLEATSTAPLLANGRNPDEPEAEPDEALQPLLSAGFQMSADSEPQLVAIDDTHFAVITVAKIVPATPRPLDEIRDRVARDYRVDKAVAKAREVAAEVVEAVKGGKSLREALAATGERLPPPSPIDTTRARIAQMGEQIPPPVQLLFNMQPGTARLIEGNSREGYYVVHLEAIEPHDASEVPELVQGMHGSIARSIGNELAGQLIGALQRDIGVSRNADAIARVRRDLTNQGN